MGRNNLHGWVSGRDDAVKHTGKGPPTPVLYIVVPDLVIIPLLFNYDVVGDAVEAVSKDVGSKNSPSRLAAFSTRAQSVGWVVDRTYYLTSSLFVRTTPSTRILQYIESISYSPLPEPAVTASPVYFYYAASTRYEYVPSCEVGSCGSLIT